MAPTNAKMSNREAWKLTMQMYLAGKAAQAQDPGNQNAGMTGVHSVMSSYCSPLRTKITRQANENGGVSTLPTMSQLLSCETAFEENIFRIKAAANRRNAIAGLAQPARAVYIVQVPLHVSAPLGSKRRQLVNEFVARSGHPASVKIFMHWAIRIESVFFELRRVPDQAKPVFARSRWAPGEVEGITTQELYGYTSLTDDEVDAIGEAYIAAIDRRYDLFDNNCHSLVQEVLHHILDTDYETRGRTAYRPAGVRLGTRLAETVLKVPAVQQRINYQMYENEHNLAPVFGEGYTKHLVNSVPSQQEMLVQACGEMVSQKLGRLARLFS